MGQNITPIMSFSKLLDECVKFKANNKLIICKRHKHCFSGDVKEDVRNANFVIDRIINNNTAHTVYGALKWGLNTFYGLKFNPKFLHVRVGEISKLTTRLDLNQISIVKNKIIMWCNENIHNVSIQELTAKARWTIYYVFMALLSSGMRIGELCSIDWGKKPLNRVLESKFSRKKFVEIIINSEKTCKQREVYVPLECYDWFVNKIGKCLKMRVVIWGICNFKHWARLPFNWSCHSLRRTKATLMHESKVDIPTIALVLGNTVKTCLNHYIISSGVNFDACDIANSMVDGSLNKINNVFFDPNFMRINKI